MKKIVIRFFQLLILLSIRLAYAGRVKVQAAGLKDISGPVVIAANHANSMDPFVIACFLPLKTIFRVYPYAFMTANVYYHRWWKPLAFLAGCYPAKAIADEPAARYGVGKSVKLLSQGYSVVMFPEGKRTVSRLEAKPGVSLILKDNKAPLVLCRIDWQKSAKRDMIRMVAEPAGNTVDMNDPDSIMKAVYSLPLPQAEVLLSKRA